MRRTLEFLLNSLIIQYNNSNNDKVIIKRGNFVCQRAYDGIIFHGARIDIKKEVLIRTVETKQKEAPNQNPRTSPDAIANLFGFQEIDGSQTTPSEKTPRQLTTTEKTIQYRPTTVGANSKLMEITNDTQSYQIQISGPGVNTMLSISEEEDISLAIALLEKIRRQLKS